MEIIASIVVAVIAGAASFAGVAVTNQKHQAVVETKLENLTKQVEKHNSVIERTYALEKEVAVIEQRLKD